MWVGFGEIQTSATLGSEFKAAKGTHFKVHLNGKATIFADHGSKEMHEGLRKSIIKQLGLKGLRLSCTADR